MVDGGITLLAFDYGGARIGVAVGNTLLKIAHPVTTIDGRGKIDRLAQIKELIDKWQAKILVVGIPQERPDNIETCNAIRNFIGRLKHNFNLPVEIVNEDFSSIEAESLLNEQNIGGIKQRGKLDQLAACVILQTYFNMSYAVN